MPHFSNHHSNRYSITVIVHPYCCLSWEETGKRQKAVEEEGGVTEGTKEVPPPHYLNHCMDAVV